MTFTKRSLVTTWWRDGKGPYEGRVVERHVERVKAVDAMVPIASGEDAENTTTGAMETIASTREVAAWEEKMMRLDQERLENLVDAACEAEGGER